MYSRLNLTCHSVEEGERKVFDRGHRTGCTAVGSCTCSGGDERVIGWGQRKRKGRGVGGWEGRKDDYVSVCQFKSFFTQSSFHIFEMRWPALRV